MDAPRFRPRRPPGPSPARSLGREEKDGSPDDRQQSPPVGPRPDPSEEKKRTVPPRPDRNPPRRAAATAGTPRRRGCGAMVVHRRLLNESPDYRLARSELENRTIAFLAERRVSRFQGI